MVTLLISSILWALLNTVFGIIIRAKGFKWFYRNVYLHTWHWRFVRWLKFKQVGRNCQKCNKGQRAFYKALNYQTGEPILDVHHLTYKHLWWEFLHLNDLQVLCRYHHNQEHHG